MSNTVDQMSKEEIVVKSLATDAEEDVVAKARELLSEHTLNFAKTMPLWMRLNWICNTLGNNMNSENFEESINWPRIHEILTAPDGDYAYNLVDFSQIKTFQELLDVREDVIMSSVMDDAPWHKQKCKQCGESFTLSLKEINWFKNKDLSVPRRCSYCRKGIQRPVKTSKVEVKRPEGPVKTNMQIALEKAGFKLD